MSTEKYVQQPTIGHFPNWAGIAAVCAVLGGIAAWGISYGGLDTRVSNHTRDIEELDARLNAKDQAEIALTERLTDMAADIRWLRREQEKENREGGP